MSPKLAAAFCSEKWGREVNVTARCSVPCLSLRWKAPLLRGGQAALAEGLFPVWPEMVVLNSRWCYGTLSGEIKFILVEGLVCWIADLGIWGSTENFEITKLPLKKQNRMRVWQNSAPHFWSLYFCFAILADCVGWRSSSEKWRVVLCI